MFTFFLAPASSLNILSKTFDPKKRMTVDEALEHPYLAAYVSSSSLTSMYRYPHPPKHDPEDEPTVTPLSPDYFEFDMHKDDLSKDQLKGRIDSLHPPADVNNSPLQNSCTTKSSHSLPPFNDLVTLNPRWMLTLLSLYQYFYSVCK
jgi:serine/threonine protein kinase